MPSSVTRGHGLLEGFLSRKRAKMADKLIPASARTGRILDVGCGSFPYFLEQTTFAEKHGIDQAVTDALIERMKPKGIILTKQDTDASTKLPYADGFFDTVTMLAVIEHIEPKKLQALLQEILRVLKRGGIFICTTPAHWTDPILKTLSRLGLVSREEIDEHEETFTSQSLGSLLQQSGFADVKTGTFELGMNLWACAASSLSPEEEKASGNGSAEPSSDCTQSSVY